jgi:hypothetical protein
MGLSDTGTTSAVELKMDGPWGGWRVTEGIVSARLSDLDGNGFNELAVFYIERAEMTWYLWGTGDISETRSALKLNVYSVVNGTPAITGETTLLEEFDADGTEIIVMIQNGNASGNCIYFESDEYGLFVDGWGKEYGLLQFDGNTTATTLWYISGGSSGETGLYRDVPDSEDDVLIWDSESAYDYSSVSKALNAEFKLHGLTFDGYDALANAPYEIVCGIKTVFLSDRAAYEKFTTAAQITDHTGLDGLRTAD